MYTNIQNVPLFHGVAYYNGILFQIRPKLYKIFHLTFIYVSISVCLSVAVSTFYSLLFYICQSQPIHIYICHYRTFSISRASSLTVFWVVYKKKKKIGHLGWQSSIPVCQSDQFYLLVQRNLIFLSSSLSVHSLENVSIQPVISSLFIAVNMTAFSLYLCRVCVFL